MHAALHFNIPNANAVVTAEEVIEELCSLKTLEMSAQ